MQSVIIIVMMMRAFAYRHSCGKTVHLKCMNVTAEHQKSQGQEILECPLCHGTFCTYLVRKLILMRWILRPTIQELNNEFYSRARPKTKLTKEFTHDGTTCSNCQMSPITGKCFKLVLDSTPCISCELFHHRCTSCTNTFLCNTCFKNNAHSHHNFDFKQVQWSCTLYHDTFTHSLIHSIPTITGELLLCALFLTPHCPQL